MFDMLVLGFRFLFMFMFMFIFMLFFDKDLKFMYGVLVGDGLRRFRFGIIGFGLLFGWWKEKIEFDKLGRGVVGEGVVVEVLDDDELLRYVSRRVWSLVVVVGERIVGWLICL